MTERLKKALEDLAVRGEYVQRPVGDGLKIMRYYRVPCFVFEEFLHALREGQQQAAEVETGGED